MGSGKNPGLACICQICTCGRHRCSHRPKLDNRPKGQCVFTEYRDTYKQFPSREPVKSVKPSSATKLSTEPFDPNTSYRNTYISHALKPRERREPQRYIKPSGKVDGSSSYQNDYIAKSAEKMPSARPPMRPSTADRPFCDLTVNRETYRPWELSVRQGVRPAPAIRLPTDAFQHQSTFQDDYKGHKTNGRSPLKIPQPTLSLSPEKLSNETTTRIDYSAKEVPRAKSARPANNVIKHAGPFDYKTTCQNSFQWHNGRPATSCKPYQMTHASKDPLDSDTTHNLTYQSWDVPKREALKPRKGWTVPMDPFDHKTTFQHDYDGKLTEPAKSARPDYNKIHPGDFDGLTTHKKEFKPWEINPRESYRPVATNKGPKGKFDGITTFQTDFRAAQASRPSLCIPKEGGVGFSGDHNLGTTYRDTFHGVRPPSCPAKSLREGTPSKTGHIYREDRNGHQYFSFNGIAKENGTLPNLQRLALNGSIEVTA